MTAQPDGTYRDPYVVDGGLAEAFDESVVEEPYDLNVAAVPLGLPGQGQQ